MIPSAQPDTPPPLRRRLPDRRRSDIVEYAVNGVIYRAQVSFFEDGQLGEVFLDAQKLGSDPYNAAHDAAVSASLALQFGCPPETLARALLKLPNGRSAEPLGVCLDLILEGEAA